MLWSNFDSFQLNTFSILLCCSLVQTIGKGYRLTNFLHHTLVSDVMDRNSKLVPEYDSVGEQSLQSMSVRQIDPLQKLLFDKFIIAVDV